MVGRSTCSNTANNTNPPNKIAYEVTQQLDITLPNLLTQLVQALGGNRANQRESAVSMANRLTTDGIKDGIFKKHKNARNKKRSNDQNKNQGRDDRNKRQRTGRKFPLTASEQGQRAKIVCFEKIVQIPLANEENLEVHRERPERNLKQLKTMKVNELKLEDIPVARNFPGVFSKDLSGLPPSRDVEFLIDLIPGAMPVAKSPYQMLKGYKQFERKEDGGLHLAERIWVPVYSNLRTLIVKEAHATRAPETIRITSTAKDPEWKRDNSTMDFITILSRTTDRKDYKTKGLARLYINEIIARHSVPVSIISDCYSYFTSSLAILQKALGTRLDLSTAYHPETDGQKFSVSDKVLLKVSPWKGMNLSNMDREVKKLKQSWIPIVKVHWNSRRGPYFTWELKDEMKCKYPQLFANTTGESPSSSKPDQLKKHKYINPPSLWRKGLVSGSKKRRVFDLPFRVLDRVYVHHSNLVKSLKRKNELKAHGTLLMALSDKHQLKFNSHKDAKKLMEAIEKRIGLDQIHDRLQKLVSQLEIHRVSLSQEDVNMNTTNSVSAAVSVSAAYVKLHASPLLNVDSLNGHVNYAARRFLNKTGRNLSANGTASMGFDMSKVECYNYHRKGYFARECRSPMDQRRPVILNGDSPAPTRFVEGVLQPVAPTTVEQKLARKNELKARGTLLMTLPKKHQLKFNSHKDAKTLMRAIEKSPTESVSAAVSVAVVFAKMPVSSLPDVDSLSNVVIYSFFASQSSCPQLDNEDLKQIDKIGRNLRANGPTSMGFDMSKVECYNCHMKGHFTRECRSPKDSRRNGAAEPQRRTVLVETFTFMTGVFKQRRSLPTMLLWLSHLKVLLLIIRFQPSDGYHAVPPPYTGIFMPPKPDLVFNTAHTTVETDHPAFTIQLSPTKPEQDLSHTNRPTTPIIEDWVSDSKDESETKAPHIVLSFVQTTKQVKSPRPSVQHAETSIHAATPKPTNCDYHEKKMAKPTARNHVHKGYHKEYAPMTSQNPQKQMVPAVVLTQSKPVSITAVRPVSADVPKSKVARPKHATPIITKTNSPIRRHITRYAGKMGMETKMPNSRPCFSQHKCINDPKKGNPQHALKDKGVIDSGCSRHMTGNMSYLSDFEEVNGRYVAFGGNPKGGKISRKGK
nr:hypothetical protein [Tanacetum cinerariifolium]